VNGLKHQKEKRSMDQFAGLDVSSTRGHLAAAILLPLYYLADATFTLLRRLTRREPVWQAHRTTFLSARDFTAAVVSLA
jgi:hypothetical protein